MGRLIGLSLIFCVFLFGNLNAGEFEGRIKVMKKTYYDTSYFFYSVKDDKVRIDQYNQYNRLTNSFILDTDEMSVFALNTNHNIYKELIPSNPSNLANQKKYEVIKTDNTKEINGYLCCQWRVRNREKNSEIAYWVTKNGFGFFDDMVKLLNLVGNSSEFFSHIPGNDGFLPILTVERTLVRYEKLRLVVTDVEHTSLSEDIFKIPSGYREFDN